MPAFRPQVRDPFGDGERCGQSGRIDSRGLHEPGLPPVAADQEVREGLLGGGAPGADAAAAGAELIQLEAGQQTACRRVEPGERLADRREQGAARSAPRLRLARHPDPGVGRRPGPRRRGAALPAAGGAAAGGLLRHRAVLLRQPRGRRHRGLDRGRRRRHPGRRRRGRVGPDDRARHTATVVPATCRAQAAFPCCRCPLHSLPPLGRFCDHSHSVRLPVSPQA